VGVGGEVQKLSENVNLLHLKVEKHTNEMRRVLYCTLRAGVQMMKKMKLSYTLREGAD